jgi:hypothetical protein
VRVNLSTVTGAMHLKEPNMGLNLLRVNDGQARDDVRVGSYSSAHAIRAVLVMALVAKLWQNEAVNPERAQDLLACVDGPAVKTAGADLVEDEVTEENLQRVVDCDKGLTIDYAYFNGEGDTQAFVNTLAEDVSTGSELYDALVGAAKFVNHSDCDGVYSRGDVLDVLSFLLFIEDAPLQLGAYLTTLLTDLRKFFNRAFDHGDVVVFG